MVCFCFERALARAFLFFFLPRFGAPLKQHFFRPPLTSALGHPFLFALLFFLGGVCLCLCFLCVLSAGEWSSSAFMKYVIFYELEASACLEAHLDEYEDEGDELATGEPSYRRRRFVIL